jgi:hypothetical protein
MRWKRRALWAALGCAVGVARLHNVLAFFVSVLLYFCNVKYSVRNLNQLIAFFKGYTDIYQMFAIEAAEKQVDYSLNQRLSGDFIIRHSINAGGAMVLLPNLQVNLAHKLSIHLIFRCMVSDILTSSTLATFASKGIKELQCEVNLLNGAFIKAFRVIIGEEQKRSKEEELNAINQASEFLSRQYAYLFNEKNEPKSKNELRQMVSSTYKEELVAFDWQENKMAERLGPSFAQAYTLYRYYSQYEHYSPMASELLEIESIATIEFSAMVSTVSFLAANTEQLYTIIEGPGNKYNSQLHSIVSTLSKNLE